MKNCVKSVDWLLEDWELKNKTLNFTEYQNSRLAVPNIDSAYKVTQLSCKVLLCIDCDHFSFPKPFLKQYERYNAHIKNDVASVYKPWLAFVAAVSCVAGVASICIAIVMKDKDDELENDFYHLWVGVPVRVTI